MTHLDLERILRKRVCPRIATMKLDFYLKKKKTANHETTKLRQGVCLV